MGKVVAQTRYGPEVSFDTIDLFRHLFAKGTIGIDNAHDALEDVCPSALPSVN